MFGRLALTVVAVAAFGACAGPAASPSPAATVASASPTAAAVVSAPPSAAVPVTFTSPMYGYDIVVPAGWSIGAATSHWDAASAPGSTAAEVDKFDAPSGKSAFVYVGPTTFGLAGFADAVNAWIVRDHGDTCPTKAPETTEPIEVDGQPGRLLLWNCGILINVAVVVRDDVGFVLVMRDPGVPRSADPADRAILDALLSSVVLAKA